ncbi:hypothetical protein BGX20_007605 [Mortierella sp. AD010]|nr:hypothetical protein BGX20_007605 [Mortierella sp. AD010]
MDGNNPTLRDLRPSPVGFALMPADLDSEDLVFALGLPLSIRGLSVAPSVCESHNLSLSYTIDVYENTPDFHLVITEEVSGLYLTSKLQNANSCPKGLPASFLIGDIHIVTFGLFLLERQYDLRVQAPFFCMPET